MMNDTPEPLPTEAAVPEDRFPSMSSLRAAHTRLLRQHSEIGETEDLLDNAEVFIRRGRATGALLDEDDKRWASQGLLDYWAAVLYRAGREPPDATLAGPDRTLVPDLKGVACPYLGLEAFGEANHEVFFGRQRLVEKLVNWLRGWLKEQRLVAVVGPSGCGKSSLVLAGFLPALKGGAVPGSESWRYYPPMVPGSKPLVNLAKALLPVDADAAGWIRDQVTSFRRDAHHLARLVDEPEGEPAVLVIDQFEEVFTLCEDDDTRQAFTDNLLGLVQAPGSRHLVILTMRVDYEDRVAKLPEFQKSFERALMRVTPLSAAELREAIVKPAESVGLKFEDGVVDALLQDILGEPAALPLLQFTLLKLWQTRELNLVTWEAYQRLGGGREALANSADEFYRGLKIKENEEAARYILLSMVRPGHGLEVTSSRIRRKTLYQAGPSPERVERVLDRLVDAHLVRLTRGETPDDDQVEVAHEALVRNWPRLLDWLRQERVQMTTLRRLEAKAAEWVRLGRGRDGLLDKVELLEAERWLGSPDAKRWLGSPDAKRLGYARELPDLVQASRSAIVRARRQRVIALTVVLVVLMAVAGLALWQWGEAETQRQLADERATTAEAAEAAAESAADALATEVVVRETAEAAALDAKATAEAARAKAVKEKTRADSLRLAAQASLRRDPQLSLLLAAEAMGITRTVQAEDALRQAVAAARVRNILSLHTKRVNTLAVSSNGRWLATTGDDGTVRLWEAVTGLQLTTLEPGGEVSVLALSPDGRWLAAGSREGRVTVWDTSAPHEATTAAVTLTHESEVLALAFGRDGDRLATGSRDGSAYLWDLPTNQEINRLEEVPEAVSALALSPDGQQLATAGFDGTVLLRDMQTGKELPVFGGQGSAIKVMAFGPFGELLATGGADGTVRLWNTADGSERAVFEGHVGDVTTVAFHPYGQLLATGGEDRTAQLWDLGVPEAEPTILFGHGDRVNAVAFQPDGEHLATASADGTVRLWNRYTGEGEDLRGHSSSVNAVAFSPAGGAWLASASSDGTARIWTVTRGEAEMALQGHESTVAAVSFSPDGKLLATGGADGTLRLWSGSTALGSSGSEAEGTILGEELGFVWDSEFSPDGTLLASTAPDWDAGSSSISLWSILPASIPTQVISRTLEGRRASGVAFSPDGKTLATSDTDLESESSTVRIWDVSGDFDEEMAVLPVPQITVYDVAFSPDGGLLAASGANEMMDAGTVRLWDVAAVLKSAEAPPEPVVLQGDAGFAFLNFSPDGQHLASGSLRGTAHLWDVAVAVEAGGDGEEVVILQGHEGVVAGIAFSTDGRLLATGDESGTVRLWEVAEILETGGSGTQSKVLGEHEGLIYRIAFSPDGPWLAAGDGGGAVRLWPLDISVLRQIACDRAIRNLSQTEWETYLGLDVPYHPTCSNLPVHRSVVENYVRLGRIDAALEALRDEVRLDPTLEWIPEEEVARLLVLRGQELGLGGKADRALAAFRQAIELDPSLRLDPEDELAQLHLERGLEAISRASFDEALTALTQAVELAPTLKLVAAEVVFEEAVGYFDEYGYLGQCEKQLALFRQAGEWDPTLETDAAGLLVELGERCATTEDYDGALAAFRQATEFDPSLDLVPEAEVARVRAREYVWQGQVEDALAAYHQAIELDPTLELDPEQEVAGYLVDQGLDAAFIGDTDEALTTLTRAIELDPTIKAEVAGLLLDGVLEYHDVYDYGVECEQSLALFRQVAEWDPALETDVAWMLADVGDRCASEGDYDTALAAFHQAIEFDSSLDLVPEAEVVRARAREYVWQGQVEDALAAFRQAVELDPTLELEPEVEVAGYLVNHGINSAYRGSIDAALAAMTRAIELDPTRMAEAAGSLLEGVSEYVDRYGCEARLDEILALSSQVVEWDPALETDAARLLADLGQRCASERDFDSALTAFRRAIEFDPSLELGLEAEMAKTRAREYVWLGQIEDALTAFGQAVELDPTLALVPEEEVARLLVGVAEEHRYAGDYDEALAALRRAVELDPEIETREEVDLARTYNQVCWRGSLDGWAEKVLPICERVVELMPDMVATLTAEAWHAP